MVQRKLTWQNPETYTDETPENPNDNPAIPADKQDDIILHIYKDGAPVYDTLPGVEEFPIEVGNPGDKSSWQIEAELEGAKSPLSPPVEWTEPVRPPMPVTMVRVI